MLLKVRSAIAFRGFLACCCLFLRYNTRGKHIALYRSKQLHIASCSISTNSASQKFGDVVLLKLTCHILCAKRFSVGSLCKQEASMLLTQSWSTTVQTSQRTQVTLRYWVSASASECLKKWTFCMLTSRAICVVTNNTQVTTQGGCAAPLPHPDITRQPQLLLPQQPS